MPAIFRMPVAYMVLATAALALGLASVRTRQVRDIDRELDEPLGIRVNEDVPVPLAPQAKLDPILRTEQGLRRKVLIKTMGAVARTDLKREDTSIPLDYLSLYFLYGEQPGFLQVGPATGVPSGWVETAATLEWDSRLMARPTMRTDRPPLVIYRERNCLLDALDGRACLRHAERCPTEGEESQSSNSDISPALGLPILTTESIPQPDGTLRTIHEVASPVRDRAAPVLAKEPPQEVLPLLKTVYLAVVIDSTASMGMTIASARDFAADLVARARQDYRDVTLRLALVEYRDRSPVFGFTTRRVTDFTDPDQFLGYLKTVQQAMEGDGTVDEQVLDGVESALPPGLGGVPGLIHLSWPSGRAGVLATKLMVLIGDAPDHDRELVRTTRLADLARSSGIAIAAVRIERPGTLSRDELRRYHGQWQTLAHRSFLPRDSSQGFVGTIAPIEVELTDQTNLSSKLKSILEDRVQQARELASVAQAEAEGKLVEYTNRQGISIDGLLPVLSDLHRGESIPASRPDPRHDGRKAPSLRKGWIAERVGRSVMVDLEVLLSRPELDAIIDELRAFEQAAVGTSESLEDLLRLGTAAISGDSAFLAIDRGDRTFAEHLRSRQGLPPARADSLMLRTQTDLLQADQSAREALDARLRSALRMMIDRRNSPVWEDPRRTVDGMAGIPYSWLDW